jgi:predicted transposase/invertase (TIGR01784 family)
VPEIQEAKKIYEKAKSDPKTRELLAAREKALRDYANDIAVAKGEGKEEGIAIGEERGIAIGEERGKRETALSMLAEKLPLETISKCTGLSVEQIKSLKNTEV